MTTEKIYHICQIEDWRAAQKQGKYAPPSVETDGFIHFSRAEQVEKVINTFYKDLPHLVLLHTEIDKIVPELKWEESDGEIFPHIYGPLNLDAVVHIEVLLPGTSGLYIYPQ